MADQPYTLHPYAGGAASVRGCVVTVGCFDGVHLGHRHLLTQVVRMAHSQGCAAVAMTFDRHPREVLQSGYRPALLTTTADRVTLLGRTGLDACAVLHFTPALARLTAAAFMRDILVQGLGATTLVMGYDHRFGADRLTAFADYAAAAAEAGMAIVRGTPLMIGTEAVSSSRIRRLLAAGDAAGAAACLGRPYRLHGRVVHGCHVGTGLGFPTANVMADDDRLMVPAHGAYAAWALTEDGRRHAAMVNIGVRPTLADGLQPTTEAHLLDFGSDLYGQHLALDFVARLRDERRFATLADLRAQLDNDVHTTRHALTADTTPQTATGEPNEGQTT